MSELFGDVAQKIANRPGGYTRILKLGANRIGDNSEMCIIELVDYNTTYTEVKKEEVKKTNYIAVVEVRRKRKRLPKLRLPLRLLKRKKLLRRRLLKPSK